MIYQMFIRTLSLYRNGCGSMMALVMSLVVADTLIGGAAGVTLDLRAAPIERVPSRGGGGPVARAIPIYIYVLCRKELSDKGVDYD